MTKAFISGCASTVLSEQEHAFFKREDPWGLILFKRNCNNPDQVRALVSDFRNCVGRANAPVLIDQEGGRVQRLRPPHWSDYPAARQLAQASQGDSERLSELVWSHARLLAHDLREIGITVDCLPCVDISFPQTHMVIGDRSFGATPDIVIAGGRAQIKGLGAGGVLSVMKHIPGHGRATVDSHLELPTVTASHAELSKMDFAPFRAIAHECPMAMTAHVVYSQIDSRAPATTSRQVVEVVIRGDIGFDGLLMTDDLSMKALGGSFESRVEASIAAGCDMLLHCNGVMEEMCMVAGATPDLSGKALRRADTALRSVGKPDSADIEALHKFVFDAVSSTAV